jgi:hypothetical protein
VLVEHDAELFQCIGELISLRRVRRAAPSWDEGLGGRDEFVNLFVLASHERHDPSELRRCPVDQLRPQQTVFPRVVQAQKAGHQLEVPGDGGSSGDVTGRRAAHQTGRQPELPAQRGVHHDHVPGIGTFDG